MSDFKAKMHQIRFRLGLCPRPQWGSLQRSHRPLAGFKGAALPQRGGREGKMEGGEKEGMREGREGMEEGKGKVTEGMGGTGQDMGWDGREGKRKGRRRGKGRRGA